jgi:hypothetical protein
VSWLSEPRATVLLLLIGVIVVGGGRKLVQALRAKRAVARLGDTCVTPSEIEAVARFGRSGMAELFQIFSEPPSPPLREAAGRALAVLWARDHLIAEEEQALVRRGFTVDWIARRRYPRAIRSPIPIQATYGLPFLSADGAGIRRANLEWSHRVLGARRAALEEYSAWSPGAGEAKFSIVPADFGENGPHRLVLQARVKTEGLTDQWQIELAHIPFSFEFDPRLEISSLLALPDEHRAVRIARSIRLESPPASADGSSRFLTLSQELAVRNPPFLVVMTPLPCDLAHQAFLEFDQLAGRLPAGPILLSGQGEGRAEPEEGTSRRYPIGIPQPAALGAFQQPGTRRLRVCLEPDADLGWTDPTVRSIWPRSIQTDWIDVEIVRR